MLASNVMSLWASGFVNRWHTYPDTRLRNAQDTTAAHAQRVTTLLLTLFPVLPPDTAMRSVKSALWHDAAEVATGDSPFWAKRALNGALRRVVTKLEDMFWTEEARLPAPIENDMIRLCDLLDAYLFCKMVAPDLLEKQEWIHHRSLVLDLAGMVDDGRAYENVKLLMDTVRIGR